MRIKLERRPKPSRMMLVFTPVASVIVTMLIGMVVFDLMGIDGARAVKDIFLTLQGEGVQAGRRAVFLRFAGCNLWSGREEDRAAAVAVLPHNGLELMRRRGIKADKRFVHQNQLRFVQQR